MSGHDDRCERVSHSYHRGPYMIERLPRTGTISRPEERPRLPGFKETFGDIPPPYFLWPEYRHHQHRTVDPSNIYVRGSTPEERRQPPAQHYPSQTGHRLPPRQDMSPKTRVSGQYDSHGYPRGPYQAQSEHFTNHATRAVDSNSTRPGIVPPHNINGVVPHTAPPDTFSSVIPTGTSTCTARRPLHEDVTGREVPQDKNKQSTDQIRQYSDTTSQSSHSISTEPYEPEHYPMSLDQLQAIAAAATAKADRDNPYSLPPGAPYREDSAPDAPGPPPASWVQKHYDYWRWNEELGYLKCTYCGVARQAHCFERADDEKSHHHELLATCLDCRNLNKKKNRSSRAKASGGRSQTQSSDEPKMMICWTISTATGCGEVKSKEDFMTEKHYYGHAERSHCRKCRGPSLSKTEYFSRMSQSQEKKPEHPAKRPSPRESQVEHHHYMTHSWCRACEKFVAIRKFDMAPFANKAGLQVPRPICRDHADAGAGPPGESFVRVCGACHRTWHIGQFYNKKGECYDCKVHGRKVPTEEEKEAKRQEKKMRKNGGGGQKTKQPENAREGY
ncbi:hypothetical protein F4809DRAFT_661853 [Biscogniauxia mediterranea]|nr:hypothetical protein F4809DRAFT_661853 [Biscogniauxia mediterranea]